MRAGITNAAPKRIEENRKYVMKITGDDNEGKAQLDNFIHPEERYPVIYVQGHFPGRRAPFGYNESGAGRENARLRPQE